MFRIWSELPKKGVIYLKLEYDKGDILLVAVNEKGIKYSESDILCITDTGKLYRFSDCLVEGIQTDDEGRIIEEK